MPSNFVDLIMRVLFDKSSGQQVIADNEQVAARVGYVWNEAAKRFQNATTHAFASKFKAAPMSAFKDALPDEDNVNRIAIRIRDMAGATGESAEEFARARAGNQQFVESLAGIGNAGKITGASIIASVGAFESLSAAEKKAAYEGQGLRVPKEIMAQFREETKRATEETRKQAKAQKELQNQLLTGVGGFALIRVGAGLERAGRQALAPIKQWSDAIGVASAEGQRWLHATQGVQSSIVKIGGSMASSVVPLMESASRTVEKIAKFFQEHPEVAKIATLASAGAIGLGAVFRTAGEIVTLIQIAKVSGTLAWVQQLFAAKTQVGAATTQVAAATAQGEAAAAQAAAAATNQKAAALMGSGGIGASLLKLIPPLLAVMAGAKINNVLAERSGIKSNSFGTLQASYLFAQRDIGAFLENVYKPIPAFADRIAAHNKRLDESIIKLGQDFGYLEKSIDPLSGSLTTIAGSVHEKEIVETFMKFNKEELAATAQTEKQRLQIIKSYGEQMVSATETYNNAIADAEYDATSQRLDVLRELGKADLEAEQRLYHERSTIIRDGGIEIERIEEDSQERLRKMRLEHNDRIADLEGQRDALGILEENRNYQRDRNAELRATNIEIARRRQDLAIRLNDLQANFEAERAQRAADAQVRLAEIAAEEEQRKEEAKKAFEEEKKQAARQRDEALRQLVETATEEARIRRQAFIDQINLLNSALTGQETMLATYYNWSLTEAQRYFDNMRAIQSGALPIQGSSASGGYVTQGLWMLHGGEYVMNASTVDLAERVAGSRLSNTTLAGMLGGGGRSIIITQDNRFYVDTSAMDKRKVKQMMQDSVVEILEEAS